MVGAQGFDFEYETLLVHLNAIVQISFHLSKYSHVSADFSGHQIINTRLLASTHALNLQKAQLEVVQSFIKISKLVEAISKLVAHMDIKNRVLIEHKGLKLSFDFLIEVCGIVKLVLKLETLGKHRLSLNVLLGAEDVLLVLGLQWRTVLLVLVCAPTVVQMTNLLV
jgi:hypothetical protein